LSDYQGIGKKIYLGKFYTAVIALFFYTGRNHINAIHNFNWLKEFPKRNNHKHSRHRLFGRVIDFFLSEIESRSSTEIFCAMSVQVKIEQVFADEESIDKKGFKNVTNRYSFI